MNRVEPAPPGDAIEPIAITGIGCRFPGGIRDVDSFWRLLADGVDAIREMPPGRMDLEAYDADPAAPWKAVTRLGGYLEDVGRFDAPFFGISPREAVFMDPQQRLLLEVAYEALEDAGIPLEVAAGQRTGVFVGMMTNDYEDLMYQDLPRLSLYALAGGGRYGASGRVSYALGLTGPSLTVDTACSSSLVSVHLACQSLRAGECTLALAGGVHLLLEPQINVCLAEADLLNREGRCRFGDARADGFVRSEGSGILVLKRLDQAIRDRDPVVAIIRGSAVNANGRSSRVLVTPSTSAQEEVVRLALAEAGLTPGQVQAVEAHGTGTVTGDRIEIEALGAVFADSHSPAAPCRIGSIKTNFGHTEGASGVASLIKAALSLRHRMLPPSLHFDEPSPNVPWDRLPVAVQTRLEPWPTTAEPARIGVNSFGLTGTNAHLVLEEAPAVDPEEAGAPVERSRVELEGADSTGERSVFEPEEAGSEVVSPAANLEAAGAAVERFQAFLLSARSPEALREAARNMAEWLEQPSPAFKDLCYTAAVRRTSHPHRLSVVCDAIPALRDGLLAAAEGRALPSLVMGQGAVGSPGRVVFVFPGQGSQWLGMGRSLLEQEPVFAASLEACDREMRRYLGFSLIAALSGLEATSRLDDLDVIQPALFALQVSLAALWRSWGVEPDGVVGHSMGEVAAAHVAGALSLEDAIRVICLRSRLVKRTRGQGGMLTVELGAHQARKVLEGLEDRVAVAAVNSPRTTVLSGDRAALETVEKGLERQGIYCRRVRVEFASHSPQMDPLRPELERVLEGLAPRPCAVPIHSTVTGKVLDGRELDAGYWVRNLRDPVMLWPVVQRLVAEGHTTFIEISPHPILLPALEPGMRELGVPCALLPSTRRDQDERGTLLESLSALHAAGHPVRWSRVYPSGRTVRLPAYPWQREYFWIESSLSGGLMAPGRPSMVGQNGALRPSFHPLLGVGLSLSASPPIQAWTTDLSLEMLPYLRDHGVLGATVFPGAAIMEMALAAAKALFGEGSIRLSALAFLQPLVLAESGAVTVQLTVTQESRTGASFRFSSLHPGATSSDATWTVHATGRMQRESGTAETPADEEIGQGESIPGEVFYQEVVPRSLSYGPAFRRIARLERGDREARAWIEAVGTAPVGRGGTGAAAGSDARAGSGAGARTGAGAGTSAEARTGTGAGPGVGPYRIHPALLDACLHATLAPRCLEVTEDGAGWMPVAVETLVFTPPIEPIGELRCHVQVRLSERDGARIADLTVRTADATVLVRAEGLELRRMKAAAPGLAVDLAPWLLGVEWQRQDLPEAGEAVSTAPGRWLILADKGGLGAAFAARLEADGHRCRLVTRDAAEARAGGIDPASDPMGFGSLLAELQATASRSGALTGVVHLWSIDGEGPDDGSPDALVEARTAEAMVEAQAAGTLSVLYLAKALVQAGFRDPPRLWVVTRGAAAVAETDTLPALEHATLTGLFRTLVHEHAELRPTVVDLEADDLGAHGPRADGPGLNRASADGPGLNRASADGPRLSTAPQRSGSEIPEEPGTGTGTGTNSDPDQWGAVLSGPAANGPGLDGPGANGRGADGLEAAARTLAREVTAGTQEREVAWRGGSRSVARVVRKGAISANASTPGPARPAGGRPFALHMATPGILEGLHLEPLDRTTPGPGEVEIEVEAAGLNFLDVMSAMGIRPDQPEGPMRFGAECAGRVVAIGESVSGLAIGDRVVAVGVGCLASHVTVRAVLTAPIPADLSFAEAATLPIVFMTAYHCLHTLGHLAAGERVLIHAGAGGVGLAAMQLALRAGAEVLATAGTPEKRRLLTARGATHVMSSRDLRWADEVLSVTGGKGVDLVLNSLDGEAIPRGLGVLAPYGRFLEIGKRDIYQDRSVGLKPFRRNLSYFAVDLARMLDERPEACGALLRTVMGLVAARSIQPLPHVSVPISSAEDAFRTMALSQHVGKITLELRDPEARVRIPRRKFEGLHAEGTYLITGGLGGIGLALAEWMAARGARSLLLLGRHAPNAGAQARLDSLNAAGIQARAMAVDVADEAQLRSAIASIDAARPLRGVVHAAAALQDATLLRQDRAHLHTVLAPKMRGAWNLHRLTRDLPLDFFVMFSSAAALLGSPGQCNYAAANAFLDALALYRRARGLPGLAIAWGAWADIGLAAIRSDRGERLEARGLLSIPPAQGLDAFGALLEQDGQLGLIPMQLKQWREFHPRVAGLPLFSALMASADIGSPGPESSALAAALRQADPAERMTRLEAHLRDQMCQVLRLPPSRIDARTSLQTLGFDSLTTLELRNRLESALGLNLPATLIWSHPTLSALTGHLAALLEPEHPPASGAAPEEEPAPVSEEPLLSPDENAALLDLLSRLQEAS